MSATPEGLAPARGPSLRLVIVLLVVLAVVVASFAVAIVWVTSVASSSDRVTVQGEVTAGASASVPVANAVVHILTPSGSQTTSTDGGGGFQFSAQPSTTYTLYAALGVHWGTAMGSFVTVTTPTSSATVRVSLTVPASDIFGTVSDARTGLPIAGASMSITDPYGSPWCCQVTGSDGAYLLWTITTGPYNVTASANGYNSAFATAIVGSTAASVRIDFPLT